MQQRLPGFAVVESSISVDVIWMHLNFDGFSDETIHVAGYMDRLIREHTEFTITITFTIKAIYRQLHNVNQYDHMQQNEEMFKSTV